MTPTAQADAPAQGMPPRNTLFEGFNGSAKVYLMDMHTSTKEVKGTAGRFVPFPYVGGWKVWGTTD